MVVVCNLSVLFVQAVESSVSHDEMSLISKYLNYRTCLFSVLEWVCLNTGGIFLVALCLCKGFFFFTSLAFGPNERQILPHSMWNL